MCSHWLQASNEFDKSPSSKRAKEKGNHDRQTSLWYTNETSLFGWLVCFPVFQFISETETEILEQNQQCLKKYLVSQEEYTHLHV